MRKQLGTRTGTLLVLGVGLGLFGCADVEGGGGASPGGAGAGLGTLPAGNGAWTGGNGGGASGGSGGGVGGGTATSTAGGGAGAGSGTNGTSTTTASGGTGSGSGSNGTSTGTASGGTGSGSGGGGRFTTGQSAELMVSGIDFNNAGGGLLFNHPGGVASDGTHLFLCDRNNNRVLVWNQLPQGNVDPDFVLGQPDLTSNDPGDGLGQLNWPVAVAVGGGRLIVTDTVNGRLLIWNQIPSRSGEPADLEIQDPDLSWPWGVWTDGNRLVVASTGAGKLLIWNAFPTRANQAPDLWTSGQGQLGTPRGITSDGSSLVVADHNPKPGGTAVDGAGGFFWKSFPSVQDQPPDFFRRDPFNPNIDLYGGDYTSDGKLVLVGRSIHIWNSFPVDAADDPDLTVDPQALQLMTGDSSDIEIVGDQLFLSSDNDNRILVYDTIPSRPDQLPDFAVGSPDIYTNTLMTHFFITNPVPCTDGTSLIATSDFDRTLSAWTTLPTRSGQAPDSVQVFLYPPWDNATWAGRFVAGGRETVEVWDQLPLAGQQPAVTFRGGIGNVSFRDVKGIALDGSYLYVADAKANEIYIWNGIPQPTDPPAYTLPATEVRRLQSDGTYLVVTRTFAHSIDVYRIQDLATNPQPTPLAGLVGAYRQNMPMGAIVANGGMFVADTASSRVLAWHDVADALGGQAPDVILGEQDALDVEAEIGRDKLYWPATLCFDGQGLWVGEFKFSGRILRFRSSP